jgi:hypothetical protein
MVKVEIGLDKYEYLITNLLDNNEFPPSVLKEIYRKRWCIETDIKRKKVLSELENFASKTSFRIKQEFYAKILILNFSNMIIFASNLDLQKETDYMIGYMKRQYTKVKPNRIFERKKSNQRLKFHWNQRRSH